jgi:hypothetical protein
MIKSIIKEVKLGEDTLTFTSLTYGDMIDISSLYEKIEKEETDISVKAMKQNLISLAFHLKKLNGQSISYSEAEAYLRNLAPEDVLDLLKIVNEIETEKAKIVEELKKK